MIYIRKVQKKGTGKIIAIPSEVCKQLDMMAGDNFAFETKADSNVATLRKSDIVNNVLEERIEKCEKQIIELATKFADRTEETPVKKKK